MVCIAFFVCLVLFVRRGRQGVTIAVPVGVMGLGVVRGVLIGITVVHLIVTFRQLGSVRAEDKQTILAAGIEEAMQYATFGASFEIPLLIVAWLADRTLRKRQRPRFPPAQPAPEGTRCAAHAEAPATHICARCGGFMCAGCSALDGNLCASCVGRAGRPTPPAVAQSDHHVSSSR